MSNWAFVAPAQLNVGGDVADLTTGGAAALFPINAKAYGSHFSSGLEYNAQRGGMSANFEGFGIGGAVGAGWGIPFVAAKSLGKMPNGVKRAVTRFVGEATQLRIIDLMKGAAWGGVSGGTRIVAGPDTRGELTMDDFHDSRCTVFGLGANFVVNGISVGVVIVSKKQPVLVTTDMVYARAIGLMAGVGLATSLDVEVSGMAYRVALS